MPASSDRGGIRIQYSKNPFGKKRDYGSFNDQSPYSPGPVAAYDQSGAYQVCPLPYTTAPSYSGQQCAQTDLLCLGLCSNIEMKGLRARRHWTLAAGMRAG